MRLLLFDIDGTLVHADGIGREVIGAALEATYGTRGGLDGYSLSGKIDRQIALELMTASGLAPAAVEAGLPAFYDHMARHGRRRYRRANGLRPCPGALELLAALRRRDDVILGLLTGNIAETAPLKLAAAGIDPALFRLGAYGAEATHRDELPAIALERAARLTGHAIAPSQTTIVGDTPADIRCARGAGCAVLAVATGFVSRDELAAHRPDFLLSDLRETDRVIRLLLDKPGGRP